MNEDEGWPYPDDDSNLVDDGPVTGAEQQTAFYGTKADVGGWRVTYVQPLTRADRRRKQNTRAIVWTYRNRRDVWTPKQLQAVLAYYHRGLNQAEAARALGVGFWTFRDRLQAAEHIALRAYASGTITEKKDERDAFYRMIPSPSRYRRRRSKKGRGEIWTTKQLPLDKVPHLVPDDPAT